MAKTGWTMADIERLAAEGKIRGYKVLGEKKPAKKKPSKFGNEKYTYEGLVFDSKRECNRYCELLHLLKAGAIGQLRRQVPYELNQGGTHSLRYIADFAYLDSMTGETIVEDAKGHKTQTYLKKKDLMLKVHGIAIKET